jgi:glycosyltransferase involved in cell wall biosynthesis
VITSTTGELMLAAHLVKCTYPDKVEIISVIHNSFENLYKEYMKFRECTDKYVAVSKEIKRILMERGITNKQLPVMTCPFCCERILKRTYTEDNNKPLRLGYAGRLDGMEHSQKRMDLMLKLIDELVARKIDFVFEFAGNGPAKKNMEEFIINNGYEKYAKLIGQIANSAIPAFWRRQDILVNCSDFEGHSIMQMEAMANGAVPVVTDVSGVRDDIINNVNGFYVPVGDYMQIADRIEYLYNHRGLLSDMGKKAHDVMYPKSSIAEHIKFWESILLDKN